MPSRRPSGAAVIKKVSRRSQGSPGTGPWLGLSSQTERQSLVHWSRQWLLLLPPGISAEVMTFYDSFLSGASIPSLEYSFLYLRLSSHSILYKRTSPKNTQYYFFNISNSQRAKSQYYPSVAGMAILWHLFTLKQPTSLSPRVIAKTVWSPSNWDRWVVLLCLQSSSPWKPPPGGMISGANASTAWNAKFGLMCNGFTQNAIELVKIQVRGICGILLASQICQGSRTKVSFIEHQLVWGTG